MFSLLVQVLDSSAFADPEFIDTSLRKYDTSPSASETESNDDDDEDNQEGFYDERITPLPHSDSQGSMADSRSESNEQRSYPLPASARRPNVTPRPQSRQK